MLGYLGIVSATDQFQPEYDAGLNTRNWFRGGTPHSDRLGDTLQFKGWGRNPCTYNLHTGWWGWSNAWKDNPEWYYYWSADFDRVWANYGYDQKRMGDYITPEMMHWRKSGLIMPVHVPWYVNSVVFESNDFMYGTIGAFYDVPQDEETASFFNCLTETPTYHAHDRFEDSTKFGWQEERGHVIMGVIAAHSIFFPQPHGYWEHAYFQATRNTTPVEYTNLNNFNEQAASWEQHGEQAFDAIAFQVLDPWHQEWLREYKHYCSKIVELEAGSKLTTMNMWNVKRTALRDELNSLLELAGYYRHVQHVSNLDWVTVTDKNPLQAVNEVRKAQ